MNPLLLAFQWFHRASSWVPCHLDMTYIVDCIDSNKLPTGKHCLLNAFSVFLTHLSFHKSYQVHLMLQAKPPDLPNFNWVVETSYIPWTKHKN